MAKAFVVIQNSTRVVARADSKQEAEAIAESLRDKYHGASFEFGKMDKRLFTTRGDTVYTPDEEIY